MNNLFKTKFDAAVIVLIPACIGINYLGKLFASVLKLPLWLDSIGTCIGGCLGGPIIGAICGAANNLIYGFSAGDNITLIYALTSLGIGAAVGIMARLGFMIGFMFLWIAFPSSNALRAGEKRSRRWIVWAAEPGNPARKKPARLSKKSPKT